MIKFVDNNTDIYGNGILIGGGGLAVIGGGESSTIVQQHYTNGGEENTIIANDIAITFFSNMNNGWDERKTGSFDTSGYWNGMGFKKDNSSDSYVLLGGGGHKKESSLSVSYASRSSNADTTDNVHIKWAGALEKTDWLTGWEADGSALRAIRPANITVGNSDKLDGYHANSGSNTPWDTIPAITSGGWMDIGKQLEFHNDNTTASDFSTLLRSTGNYSNVVNLPSGSGTLALTSDIPTKVSSLSNDSGYITSSGSCAYATSAGNADKVDGVHVTWAGSITDTSWLAAWENGSSIRCISPSSIKLSRFTDDILSGKYLPLSGGTLTGSLRINNYLFAYRYSVNSNAPAIVFDKQGSYYTGIGACGIENTIYFGAVKTDDMTWANDFSQIWVFNGRISQPKGKHLYLGRADNEGWIYCQDIASEVGSKMWAIHKNSGNAEFSGIVTTGNLLSKGGVTAYSSSDIRLKQDLRKLDYLGIIKAMGGTFGFAWKKDNTRSIGWIAQHVLCNPYLKDIVETDEKGYYKINYWSPKLIATAFGAIEQVGDEVSRLKARVVFLESEVQRLSGEQGDSDNKRLGNKNIKSLN